MKVIVVDDDYLQIELLKEMLTQHPEIKEISAVSDAINSIQIIKSSTPDVVFLDVNMPNMSGIELAQSIIRLDMPPIIVFTTSFENYAVKAFDLNAADYLIKPYSKERLFQAIDKIRIRMSQRKTKSKERHKIAVQEEDAIVLLDVEDIYYIETSVRKTFIYTKYKKYETKETLSVLEEKLKYEFVRCHKSCLVNLEKINRIEPMFNRTYVIKFDDAPYKVAVSRKYSKDLLEWIEI